MRMLFTLLVWVAASSAAVVQAIKNWMLGRDFARQIG